MNRFFLFPAFLTMTFAFPSPSSYGQNLPEQSVPDRAAKATPASPLPSPQIGEGVPPLAPANDFVNTLVLAELSVYKKNEDIKRCAERLRKKVRTLGDEKLREMTLSAVEQVIEHPEDVVKIRQEHLQKLSDYFLGIALAAREGKRNEDVLTAVQIALKCDPSNARARILFAGLIDPAAALQTLHYGIKFLDVNSEIAPAYFNKYFDALANLQQDRIAVRQSLALLKEQSLPKDVRSAIANHAAMSLFWIGEYIEALKILDGEKIADTQQGMILKSRCLFELGRTREAIALLSDNIDKFPSEKRDVILSQLSHFMQYMGDLPAAIKIADRRIQENPTAPAPYLQRLYLFYKANETENFNAELEQIFTTFSASQTALTTLANFAAESGKPEIALRCAQCATENKFDSGVFLAAYIEALVVAGKPETAIHECDEIFKNSPKTFDSMESSINAILAAAYAYRARATPRQAVLMRAEPTASASGDTVIPKPAEQTSPLSRGFDVRTGKPVLMRAELADEVAQKKLLTHADLLLSQYLSDKTLTPESFISVENLFKKIGAQEARLEVAEAALKAFPWHSQIRANAISARLELNLISGNSTRAPIEKEIRVLATMRRPAPEIWQEIASWLSTQNSLSPEETSELKKLVAPLAKVGANRQGAREF